jgi:undecaprenyl-diphosphatase
LTIIQAVILGIVQGLTEFLPVSSSGHLVIVPALLGWSIPEDEVFVFDVLVQVATLVAVFAYFWKDLAAIVRAVWKGILDRRPFDAPEARLGWLIVLATIPAGLAGLLFKDQLEAAFSDVRDTAIQLPITGGLLVLAEFLNRPRKEAKSLTAWDSFWIGCFQALALVPGISRSGSTITGGVLRGLSRDEAARFSFLLVVPVMLAAGALSILDLTAVAEPSRFIPALVAGLITSAVTGYLAIAWLLRFLRSRSLIVFAVYVSVLAIAVLLLV